MAGRLKAEISVRFKESEFHPLSRRKHFTEIDILSFVGGLLGKFFRYSYVIKLIIISVILGLFLGFSFLSFIELIYHFTFRICFLRLRKNEETEKVSSTFNHMTPHQVASVFLKLKSAFVNYMENSSIHGLAYLIDVKKHSMERWLIRKLAIAKLMYKSESFQDNLVRRLFVIHVVLRVHDLSTLL